MAVRPAPGAVLRDAPVVPAQFMGVGDRLGTVTADRTASLILLRANPLADVANVRQIEGVFLRGQYFSRTDLDRFLAEAKALVRDSFH